MAAAEPPRRQEIRQGIAGGHCFVADDAGRPVGYVLLDTSFFGYGLIRLLYTHPAQRRRGVATALIRFCEARCPTEKLFTSTNLSNTPMQVLLAQLGYQITSSIDNLDEGDPELVYFKRLGRS